MVPATDTALMLGLAHTLLTEGRHDRDFLDRCTTGFETFARYLDGGADGTPKSADWAAGICGVAAEEIRRLARRMAASRTMVTVTWSLQRARHGEQPVWAGLALAAMLGQIGLPGGGFGHGYGSMGDVGDHGPRCRCRGCPKAPTPSRSSSPAPGSPTCCCTPARRTTTTASAAPTPTSAWCTGRAATRSTTTRTSEAAPRLRRPDTVVVHDPHWTATARHADIVLPATTTLEREDFGAGRRDTHLIAMHRVVDPVGLARDDHTILAELAARLGFARRFTEGRTPREWLAHLYGTWRTGLKTITGADAPGFEEFWAAGSMNCPRGPRLHPLRRLQARPGRAPAGHPSGRIEITSATVAGFGLPDCPGHPAWLEPEEWAARPPPHATRCC
ncbi:molybdopterin-dependent oxidoreductase [Streptomyces sp. M19]